jgi:hypothetical protein
LRIRRSNGIDAPTNTTLDLLVGKVRRILWDVTHELVSGSRKNGGWKPTTNHPENQQRRKPMNTGEFSVDPTQEQHHRS